MWKWSSTTNQKINTKRLKEYSGKGYRLSVPGKTHVTSPEDPLRDVHRWHPGTCHLRWEQAWRQRVVLCIFTCYSFRVMHPTITFFTESMWRVDTTMFVAWKANFIITNIIIIIIIITTHANQHRAWKKITSLPCPFEY